MSNLPDVLSAVVLGPDDRLVLVCPGSIGLEPDEIQEAIDHVGLRDRVLFVLDDAQAYVFRATKAEGATVGECADRTEIGFHNFDTGLRSVQAHWCHLAAGHAGAHSDGTTTWTEPQ